MAFQYKALINIVFGIVTIISAVVSARDGFASTYEGAKELWGSDDTTNQNDDKSDRLNDEIGQGL